jgi:transposase
MQIHDALRLALTTPLSDRQIGAAVGISKTTVRRYRHLAHVRRLTWTDLAPLSPPALRERFNRPRSGNKRKAVPDLAAIHEQLQGKGATLQVIWEDLRRSDPHHCLSYSQLAARLRVYRAQLPEVMRQTHVPGERGYVDYSGLRPFYTDPNTHKKVHVELFVGVLGASSLIFATCTATQQVPDFIRAHVAMLDYFGGVPLIVVPDNLRSAVTETGRIPKLQRTYEDFGRHYNLAILPARPYHPKDKGKVEVSVQIVQRHIVKRLEMAAHYSLEELNEHVARLLEALNQRPMKEYGQSRRERFEHMERAALRPLPGQPYVYAQTLAIPKVGQDYHVRIERHFYSVPHTLIGAKLEAKITADTVEIFHMHQRVARHARSNDVGGHTTDLAHMPDHHRAQAERTPDHVVAWAKTAGHHVARLVKHELAQHAHPAIGMPACEEIQSLARKHGNAVINEAAGLAFDLKAPSVSTLKRILKSKRAEAEGNTPTTHRNLQGARAYRSKEVTP